MRADLREGNRIKRFLKVTSESVEYRSIALMGRWDAHCDCKRQDATAGKNSLSVKKSKKKSTPFIRCVRCMFHQL